MHLSAKARYAIAILLELKEPTRRFSTAFLAEKIGISVRTVEKTHAILRSNGITEGTVGARGGISLTRPLSEVSLGKVMSAFDGNISLSFCNCGEPGCQRCELWENLSAKTQEIFEEITLSSIIPHYRIMENCTLRTPSGKKY